MAVRPDTQNGGNWTIPTGLGFKIEPKDGVSNSEFTRDATFRQACALADVKATTRQASKYRNGFGKALGARRQHERTGRKERDV
jgi:hypothetical protein